MDGVRAHVMVYGKVTDVGFRYWIVGKARKLGLRGWVQNAGENVEIMVEGQKQKVEKLIQFCHEGPPLSTVDHVDVTQENYQNEFEEFAIKK